MKKILGTLVICLTLFYGEAKGQIVPTPPFYSCPSSNWIYQLQGYNPPGCSQPSSSDLSDTSNVCLYNANPATFTTAVQSPIYQSNAADPADSGKIRLGNAEGGLCFEASPTGTDVCLDVDTSEVVSVTGGNLQANTGDSATSFFSTGTLEDGRLSTNVSLLGQSISFISPAEIVDECAGLESVRRNSGDTAWECYTPGSSLADNIVNWNHILYTSTLAGNPAMNSDECYFMSTATGGCFICEGSTADTSEQSYCFPDVNGADTTNRIVINSNQITSVEGSGLASSGGLLATASGEQGFLASGALTCGASTNGKMQVHTTPIQYCDNSATPTLRYSAYGDSTGNAVSIPNGTNPTVDAQGKIAQDTTQDQIVYGSSAWVLDAKPEPSGVIFDPADTDNFLLTPLLNRSYLILNIHCIVDPADSSESVVIALYESNSTGDFTSLAANGVDGTTTITCDNDGATDDGSLSNGTIAAGNAIGIDIGTVTGTVSVLTIGWQETVVRQ